MWKEMEIYRIQQLGCVEKRWGKTGEIMGGCNDKWQWERQGVGESWGAIDGEHI